MHDDCSTPRVSTFHGSTDSLRRVSLPVEEFGYIRPGDFLTLSFVATKVTNGRDTVLVEVDPWRMVEHD